MLPAFLPLAGHYFGSIAHGLIPTGFVLYDMPYYWANGRELSDDGGFHLFYGNPFSSDYATPRIYFQPLTLVLGIMARAGVNPGVGFALTGLAGAVICGRLAIALYERFDESASKAKALGLMAFFWGGGLLVLTGVAAGAAQQSGIDMAFQFDPQSGWWFLNFGRNLVFPTEAVYHAIFFASILLILSRRFAPALGVLALMSISHPFTGLQLLLIVIAWCLLEVMLHSRAVPLWFMEGVALLAVAHLGYYLFFLNQFAEHRELEHQWTLRWVVSWRTLFLANALVGALVIWRLRSGRRAREVLAAPPNRLLIVWFIVSVLLAKHELFVARPIQPIHFTRGYQWIPLFLLGIPVLTAQLSRISRIQRRYLSFAGLALLLFVFVADNVTWLTVRTFQAYGAKLPAVDRRLKPLGIALKPDEAEVLHWLNLPSNRGAVVASEADTIGYLVTTYTPLRSWRSHMFNTPSTWRRADQLKVFFGKAQVPQEWRGLSMLVVFRAGTDWRSRLAAFDRGSASVVFANRSFVVGRVRPPG